MGLVNSPRSVAAGLIVVVFALLATACGGIKNPEGWASPVGQDSTIYYFPKKDRVAALSVEGGLATETWTFPAPNREDQKDLKFKAVYDAASDGTTLYFGSWDGRVLALDGASGEVRWTLKSEIQGGIVGGPIIAGDYIAFGTTDGRVYVRQRTTGSTAPGWPDRGIDFPVGVWAAPVYHDGTLYIATMGGEVWAYDIATATPTWPEPFKTTGAIADLAFIEGGRLFVPSFNKKVYVLDAATGREIAQPFAASDWIWSRPAVADGTIYFGDFSGKVYALDITTLTPKWPAPYDSGASVKAAPVVIGDTLVVANRDPEVHFINTATGQRLNMVPLNDAGTVRASLVEYDGKALVATTKGRLFLADPERWAVTPLAVVGAQQ
jgi:outer membrane protein assembly factor BamB